MNDPGIEAPKLHKQEEFKAESNGLEGTVPGTYASDASHFEERDLGILKTHGTYQQDNRDERTERKRANLDKAWIFMVRCKIPGGRVTADQYLALDEIAGWTYGSLRVTVRQGIQFHGVGKANLKKTIKAINDSRLTSLGACGDVNRNVMACPVSDLDWRTPLGLEDIANQLADHFAPHSTAYYEVWCDGEKLGKKLQRNREEPIYGKTYLPRKFKMAVTVPEDNCVDIYTHDLGVEVVHDGKKALAYDLIIGGGMGYTFSKEETYPRMGSRFVRVGQAELVQVVEEIVKIQRDFGGRVDRNHARLKYLLDDRGLDWAREELFRRLGRELPEAGASPAYEVQDHLGWNEDKTGRAYLGIPIANGRIQDTDEARIKTGLRALVERFRPSIRLTPHQNVILAGLDPAHRDAVERMLDDHGIKPVEQIAPLRRRAIACPALPTCGLALADSERAIPQILARLEELGSADRQIEMRMTGCPNSCVRTPNAEIAITGRGPGKYAIHVGGSPEGTRLALLLDDKTDIKDVPETLHLLIQAWKRESRNGERFGDWSHRVGIEPLTKLLTPAA